jgi:hypothetical protein
MQNIEHQSSEQPKMLINMSEGITKGMGEGESGAEI